MPPKRGRSSAAVAEEVATPPPPAFKRPVSRKSGDCVLDDEVAPTPSAAQRKSGKAAKAKEDAVKPAEDETPPKRLRKSRTKEVEGGDTQDSVASLDTEAKRGGKAVAAPKRDKNLPIARSATPRPPLPDAARPLRLLSLNVAGLRSVLQGEKAALLKALIEQEAPDVFCLNEHKLKEDDVEEVEATLRELLPKEYGTIHWSCSTAKKGYSGVAILLRHESPAILDPASLVVRAGMGEKYADDPIIASEGRVLTVELPELFVVAVYVPNSGTDLGRLSYRVDRGGKQCWDRALAEYVRSLEASAPKPVVVIGDMNCCHRVQDFWNAYERPDFPEGLASKPVLEQYTGLSACKKAAGITVEERESFSQLLADADLVDTFRLFYPVAEGSFSYYSQRFVQNRPLNRGLRLDYVLASKRLVPDVAVAEETSLEAKKALPSLHSSYVLEDFLVADHTAVGCCILLPPSPASNPAGSVELTAAEGEQIRESE